jgi:hypothetical protein
MTIVAARAGQPTVQSLQVAMRLAVNTRLLTVREYQGNESLRHESPTQDNTSQFSNARAMIILKGKGSGKHAI